MESINVGPAHWAYLAGVVAIVVTMAFRANVVVPSIAATFLVALAWTGSPVSAVGTIFNASFVAAKELFNIFLVIALMTALLNALKDLKADTRMVEPFRAVMKNGHVAYFVLAAITYAISLFFWPTPAVPLVAAVLLPAAIAAGMPPLMGAVAIAIAGQGMALSSDYVIGVAPGISSKAAGGAVSAGAVGNYALALSLITGLVALVWSYLALRKGIQAPCSSLLANWMSLDGTSPANAPAVAEPTFHKSALADGAAGERDTGTPPAGSGSNRWTALFAVLTPLAFGFIVLLMLAPRMDARFPSLKGGNAAALIGGTAAILMALATWAHCGARRMLEASADHVTAGFVFAFKAMGAVLPIAGFFFLGAGETAAQIIGLPGKAPDLLFQLVQSAQHWIPTNPFLVAAGVLVVGMITGIDGSGFSGLPLTGALAGALGPTVGLDVALLAAIGQMGAVWTGGGTLIAWSSMIAVAGFARVPVLDAVRALLVPVLAGLAVSTTLAVILWK